MRYAVLGTGMVGTAIGHRLVELGHDVCLGSRTADNPTAMSWVEQAGAHGSMGTFAEAAEFGQRLFNCLPGIHAATALSGLSGLCSDKVLVDVSNALDFSGGFPPSLAVVNTDSVGEQLQRALPEAFVVKALNTVTASIMVNPQRIPGSHQVFMAGDDFTAKTAVRKLLGEFGWPESDVIDLGEIEAARATEMYLPLWLRLMGHVGSPDFNVRVITSSEGSG